MLLMKCEKVTEKLYGFQVSMYYNFHNDKRMEHKVCVSNQKEPEPSTARPARIVTRPKHLRDYVS